MSSVGGIERQAWPPTLLRHPFPGVDRTLRRLGRGAVAAGVLIGLTGLALGVAAALVPRRGDAASETASSRDGWTEVNRPFTLFSLSGTAFSRLPLTYRAQRRVSDDGRRDLLTFGTARGETALLQLSLYRIDADARAPEALAGVMREQAGSSGLKVLALAASQPLATRFGPFETAGSTMAGDGAPRSCLGFRNLPASGGPLRMSGLACAPPGQSIGRDELGCVLDKLDLVSAGEDVALREFFVDAERRRGVGCRPSPRPAERTTWLDANASLPTLRGSSAAGPAPR